MLRAMWFSVPILLSDNRVPASSTIVGFEKVGAFFENDKFPFVPVSCDSISRIICCLSISIFLHRLIA